MTDVELNEGVHAEDPRVAAVLQEYLSDLESGRFPDRSVYLARHPELSATLAEAFDSLDFVHGALRPRGRTPEPIVVPSLLGDFQIVREVGRGGMGVVYEAEQVSLGRRVALKVLPFAAALDARHLHRFKKEAQAAAHLHHSNIVPVFAVGCDRGVHYYAMQFIDGQTLADVIRNLRRENPPIDVDSATGSFEGSQPNVSPSATTPIIAASTRSSSEKRDYKALAKLGVQAAEALEYAHAMGVVHRDIKPANLLVDGQGHIWVADFGLAHVHGVHDLTVSGDMLGTLRYMSPEQAAGRRGVVDHHADIYSLGVTLYELLTLHDPYPARDREEILRKILHDDPRAPRKVCKDLPIELETILLKSMAKNPSDRYATAQEFADDLRRFIDDKPVLARRPTLAQIVSKWAKRHKGLVRTAFLLVCIVCVALAIVAGALHDSRRRTTDALNLAKSARQETRNAFDSLYEVADQAVAGDPQKLAARKAFLERALNFYERFAGEYGDDPAVTLEQAKTYISIGFIRQQLGDLNNGAEPYVKARKILEPMVEGPERDLRARKLLAECCNSEGIFAAQTGQTERAAQLFRRAVDLQEGVLKDAPGDERARFMLAKHTSNLGAILLEERKYEAARTSLEAALEHLEAYLSAKGEPTAADRRQLALNHHNIGVVHHRMDQPELARRHWNQALEISQQLVRDFPFEAHYLDALASSTLSLGVLCYDSEEYADAERFFRDAQAGYAKLLGQFPTMPSYRSEHGRCTHGLARSLREQGKLNEAQSVLESGEGVLEKLTRDFPDIVAYRIDLLKSRIDHANLLADAGQLAEAEAIGGRAWSETADGPAQLPPKPDVRAHWLKLRNNLADYAWRQGKRDDAVEGFKAACVIGEQLVVEHPGAIEFRATLGGVRANLSRLLQQLGRNAESESVVRSMLKDYEKLAADDPTKPRWTINRIWALVRLEQVSAQRDNPEATKAIRTEYLGLVKSLATDFDDQPIALAAAAWVLDMCPNESARNPGQALEYARRACKLAPESPEATRALGVALVRIGDGPAAVAMLERAKKLYRQRDRITDLALALAYADSGRTSTGRREYLLACKAIDSTHEHSEDLDRIRSEADRRFSTRSN